MPHIGKHADGQRLIDGVVFGQQQVQWTQGLRCPQQGHAGGLFCRAGQIELGGEEKGAASAHFAVDPDLSAHAGHEPFADGQAEAGTAIAARGGRICLREALEDQVQFVRGNAYASVMNGKT